MEVYRRTGRSTRMIDEMVQQLFSKGEVIVSDHYYSPDNDQPTRNNLNTLLKRLYNEHGVAKDHVTYDERKRKLTLKKSYFDRNN